jgi:hypothetical protein
MTPAELLRAYLCEREGAGACAVVGLVGAGRDDPPAPAHSAQVSCVGDQATPLAWTLLHLATQLTLCSISMLETSLFNIKVKRKTLLCKNMSYTVPASFCRRTSRHIKIKGYLMGVGGGGEEGSLLKDDFILCLFYLKKLFLLVE